jgi:glycosyltransferase involved in cell wall biosynthesis
MPNDFQSRTRISVGWMASGFVGRPASGTAYVSWKIIEQFLIAYSDEFEVVLFTKNSLETDSAEAHPLLRNATIIQLPAVSGKFLRSSRQYFKYANSTNKKIDFLFFSVARVYPFYWKFPAKKFISIFHAAGDVTVRGEKFVLSKHIYNLINKIQWKHFDAVIAVSEFARNEIIQNYGVAAAAVRIIPPGVDSFLQDPPKKPELIQEASRFVAIIGRWQGFKNVEFACRVMRNLNFDLSRPIKIVLVGRSNVYGQEKVLRELSKHPKDQLITIEYLEPGELMWLYRNAELVIVPSLNEGFGMPSFEAYAGGAKLLVHAGTPASTILKDQEGVYFCNMQDFNLTLSTTKAILMDPTVPQLGQRLQFILDKKLRWSNFAERYADLVREQSWY